MQDEVSAPKAQKRIRLFHPILSLRRPTENHPHFRLIISDTLDCQQLKNQPTTINNNPPTKQTMNASKTANANSRHKILNISMNTSPFLPPDITPHLHSSKQPSKFLGDNNKHAGITETKEKRDDFCKISNPHRLQASPNAQQDTSSNPPAHQTKTYLSNILRKALKVTSFEESSIFFKQHS